MQKEGNKMTKITIITQHNTITIKHKDGELNLDDMLSLVEDALLGLGYRFEGHLDFVE